MIDLQKMLDKQIEFDNLVYKNNNVKREDVTYELILAQIVELAELANETKCFKYWKKDKHQDRAKILEEYADVLHFALSLYASVSEKIITEGVFEVMEEVEFDDDALTMGLLGCISHITRIEEFNAVDTIAMNLIIILKLGFYLGFTENEIAKAYEDKHQINIERQHNGY